MTPFIPDIIAKRAALTPGSTAFRDLLPGTSMSYLELDERARRAAGLMASLGVSAGDRIAILCRNRTEFFELLFACGKLGAILVPLNWRMPAAELLPLVNDAEPAVLLFGREDAATAAKLALSGMQTMALDDDGTNGYSNLRDQSESFMGRAKWPAAECWYLLYTSGTTGKPKAVIQTYGMAMANYVNIRQAMSIGAGDVTLNYLPHFHTAGINLVALPTLIEGGEVLIMPDFDLDRFVSLLEEGVLDTFFAVPAVYQQISLHPAFDSMDLSRIRNWACGGAPLPDELLNQYIVRGARVCNGMGMTETGPTVFIMDPEMVSRKIGSVGKPQLLSSVRIVDSRGRDVADGESGELWFAGPGITPGYWRRDDVTAEAFSRDGWLKSGDMGRCDEDGYFYIVGRIKDMFISGGENVYPAEIENVLAAHPDILEAAVIAKPDPKWGEVGCAYLLPKPSHSVPPDNEVTEYCREHLAPYKIPKFFVPVEDFPRTAAGKVQKHLLKGSR
ncbi:MAG: long-chain fatty acid--CoA ligase [Proteobacteria bacterium]|nr:long-chain fatty acid--CoA ligase [Pseudomonadota bacterium]